MRSITSKPARSSLPAIGSIIAVVMRVAHRHWWPSRSVVSMKRISRMADYGTRAPPLQSRARLPCGLLQQFVPIRRQLDFLGSGPRVTAFEHHDAVAVRVAAYHYAQQLRAR